MNLNNVILNESNYIPKRTCSVFPRIGRSGLVTLVGKQGKGESSARRWHKGVLGTDNTDTGDSYMVQHR